MIQAVSLAAPVGLLLGVPISVFVSNRFEKRVVVFVSLAVLTIYYAIMPVLEIFGFLPRGQALWTMLIVFQLIVGAVTACAAISFQSMMADAADEHEVLFGTRREGLYFAGLNFAAKAASGLGALVAGIGLDLIGFPTNLAAHAQPEFVIAAPTLTRLGWVIGPGVAAIYLISTLIFLGYRLDRPAYAKIQQVLEARRRAATG
jgi:GPH family glycoside/pentoside/hexuronide:cation symporter